ncbi:hypothetical protein F4811DRAFT_516216 [Daldinia bambusicola]|nr:hypothetical protein F4811DRAFT_516216 [Daldinia bambusicola]
MDSGSRVFFAYTFQNSPDFSIQDQIVHWRELASTVSSGLTTLGMAYDGWIGDPRDPDTAAVINLALESKVKALTTHDVEGPWSSSNNPELLHWLGILNTSIPIVISHASQISAHGAELLRQTNQHISITAESEMHYGHLHPTSHLILDQASLGVDTHFTFSTDILTQARLWLQSTRSRLYKTAIDNWQIPANSPMSVNQAFLLATRNGGLALGRPDLGVIKPDAKADILIWDGRSPGMLGWVDPISAVVLHANVGDIKDVIVGGEFRKREGKLVVEDYAGIQDRFLQSAKRVQAKLKEIPLPAPEGRFKGEYPYAPVLEVDVQRGEGTGYGPIFA